MIKAIRDFLVMILTCIPRGFAAVGAINQNKVDWAVTDSSSKQSAAGHAKYFDEISKTSKNNLGKVQ